MTCVKKGNSLKGLKASLGEGSWYVDPEHCGETAKKRYGVSAKEISDEKLSELRWYANAGGAK